MGHDKVKMVKNLRPEMALNLSLRGYSVVVKNMTLEPDWTEFTL